MTRTDPPSSNADYLVIANNSINYFTSDKRWLVGSYNPLNIPPKTSTTTMYNVLWDRFGKGRATDRKSPTDYNGDINFPNSGVYQYGGDFTINSCGSPFAFNGNAILFVGGNLTINANIGPGCNYNGGRIVFVVSGNINVASSVSTLNGYFVTNGTFDDGTSSTQLIINGGLAAFGQISFNRTYSAGPAEQIDFDPGYLWYFRDLIGDTKVVFREVAP
jgi:hypothetical protein